MHDLPKIETNLTSLDYRLIFEWLPGLYLVLSPDLIILQASYAYLKATMTSRDEIVGRHLFEVFPDNPNDLVADGVRNLNDSLNFVIRNKKAHTMAVQKYDVRGQDGSFEERYWSSVNSPVMNSEKELKYIIHRVEDVTEFIHLESKYAENKESARKNIRAVEIEIIQRAKAIQELNQQLEERAGERAKDLADMVKSLSDYQYALDASSTVVITGKGGKHYTCQRQLLQALKIQPGGTAWSKPSNR